LTGIGAQEWRAHIGKNSAYRFWTVGGLYAATIKEEPDRSGRLALSLAEGIHQLLEGCGTLDLEEDLVVVVGNLNVEMLALATSLSLLGGTWASVIVGSGHVGKKVKGIWSLWWLAWTRLSLVLARFVLENRGECLTYKTV
jgi:hypothetical protein